MVINVNIFNIKHKLYGVLIKNKDDARQEFIPPSVSASWRLQSAGRGVVCEYKSPAGIKVVTLETNLYKCCNSCEFE